MERAEIAELFYNALINLNDLEKLDRFQHFQALLEVQRQLSVTFFSGKCNGIRRGLLTDGVGISYREGPLNCG